MRISDRSLLLANALLLAVACGCGRTFAPKLVGGIPSWASPEEIRRLLQVSPVEWKVIFDNKTKAERPGKPKCHRVYVQAGYYCDMGVGGTLFLYFFNDRLVSANFYPEDLARYRTLLETKRGFGFVPYHSLIDMEGNRSPTPDWWEAKAGLRARMKIQKDPENKWYVEWYDSFLMAELDRAMMRS